MLSPGVQSPAVNGCADSSAMPQASPSKRRLHDGADILPKMARMDLSSFSNRRSKLLDSGSAKTAWMDFEKPAISLLEPSPSHALQTQSDADGVESFVLGVMRSHALQVSPVALDYSSHAVMDMVCAAHRHKNQASLALVPYKACDEVVMENLTAFQQNEQTRLREQQQRASLIVEYNSQQQQQQQQLHQQRNDVVFLHSPPECPDLIHSENPAVKRRRLAVGDLRCSDSSMDGD
jgi:hypothetical protein